MCTYIYIYIYLEMFFIHIYENFYKSCFKESRNIEDKTYENDVLKLKSEHVVEAGRRYSLGKDPGR